MAGAPPPGSPEDVYAGLVRRAQALGVAVLVDARGAVLMQALTYSPVLAKLNDQELVATCGRPIDTEKALREAAEMLISKGCPMGLGHPGRARRLAVEPNPCLALHATGGRGLNTVGSGDATTAGIAAGLIRGQSVPDAVRLGITCGSASAMRLTPGDLDADLVRQLVPEVSVAGSKPGGPLN